MPRRKVALRRATHFWPGHIMKVFLVICDITCYNCVMIVSIRHKGLLLYYEHGNGSKLPAAYLGKVARIFDQLDAVTSVDDIKQMGSGIHKLTGDLSEFWSVKVSPNFRIIFRFENGDIFDIDYVDYH